MQVQLSALHGEGGEAVKFISMNTDCTPISCSWQLSLQVCVSMRNVTGTAPLLWLHQTCRVACPQPTPTGSESTTAALLLPSGVCARAT